MKHNYYIKYENIELRPLLYEDIEKLREWRNNPKKTKFLRDIGYITKEMQEDWFNNYLNNGREIIFAILETNQLNKLVGSLSLYNIKDNVAEIGRIQIGDEQAHGKGIGKKALGMVSWFGFSKLNLNKIIAEVHQENFAAHKNHMSIGFEIIGKRPFHKGGFEDEVILTKEQLLKNFFVEKIIFMKGTK